MISFVNISIDAQVSDEEKSTIGSFGEIRDHSSITLLKNRVEESIRKNIDVICIQGTLDTQDNLVQNLKEKGYTVLVGRNNQFVSRATIALKTEQFKDIQNISHYTASSFFYGREITACNVTVKKTGHKISIAALDEPHTSRNHQTYLNRAITIMDDQFRSINVIATHAPNTSNDAGQTRLEANQKRSEKNQERLRFFERNCYKVFHPKERKILNEFDSIEAPTNENQVMIRNTKPFSPPVSFCKKISNFTCNFFCYKKEISIKQKQINLEGDHFQKIEMRFHQKSYIHRFWKWLRSA